MARAAGLDLTTIVAASLAIADAEGVHRLTMRRLSAELGVTPMAVYHHLDGKEQLLDLVVDESLRGLPVLDVAGDPHRELSAFFLAFHRLLVTHPSLAQAMAGRPLEGPVAMAAGDRVLELLGRAGLDDRAAAEALIGLFSLTLGAGLYRIARSPAGMSRSFPAMTAETTPVAHRLRRQLSEAPADEQQFLGALDRLVRGYVP